MDAVNPTILKMTIEAIPILTEENFSSWRTRISALFKLGGVKDQMLAGEPALEENDNTMLCAIIIAKVSPATHSNVVNATNEVDAQLLWKAILKRFISSEPSNRARVYNAFANISFDASNIEKFITEVRSSIVKMEDVGIKLPEDIITYDLLRRLPSSLDNIKQSITHSKDGEDIVPQALLDHLEIHLNELKVSHANQSESITATMFTKEDPRCIPGHHNPYAKSHPKEECWKVYPEKREAFMKRKEASQVSSFSTFSFNHPSIFILDSGSTSHMVSDRNLFTHLDENEGGMINTSCGTSTLKIGGKGTIQLLFRNHPITLHNVLFVPKITVNLLSLRHLLIEQCTITFSINHFTVRKNNEIYLEGRYQHNLPVLELLPLNHHSHLSSAELIHKSLGHVSYRRIRQKLGIPVKAPEVCKSCALVKVTKATFKHRSSTASKPLEEIHLDLIGPIALMSHKKHKYILTIVDANTRYVAAVPLVTKANTFKTLTHVINLEAKRLGYYPSVIHSDRGTEFKNAELDRYCQEHVIRQSFSDAYTPQQNGLAERFNRTILESLRTVLLDSGLKATLWNEILGACTLTLNQIPSHRSKKSPYELFKKSVIPLQFFKPVGNPLVVLSNDSKSKLEPRGDFGRLLGFNTDLKSYRIQLTDGRIIDSKNVQFLDFDASITSSSDLSDLILEQQQEQTQPTPQAAAGEKENVEEPQIKKEEDGESDELDEFQSPDEYSSDGENDGVQDSVPTIDEPVGRILRDRTLQVKPVKYTHFSEYSLFTDDPKTFRGAVSGPNTEGWKNAIDDELNNIENHEVWLDQEEPPPKFLKHTWVFKTKPKTNSSPEKQKARLCIQGFLQTYGEDFFETFAPTGKFPSLLTLLVLAIDLQLPIKQFDVKSAFLFAPLEEEIYIKTPEGSKRKAPYLKVVKSLYGLKQAPKNWYETLTSWFQDIDYNPSVSDACLFIHKDKNSFIFFHVDDLLVVGRTEEFENLFLERFPNSTAHAPDTLLGMNLNILPDAIELSQPALIEKGLELLDLQHCRTVKTPLTPAIQLHSATDEDHAAFLKLNVNYRSYTGMLNYLACRTRPDLASAVSILSKFNQKPGLSHWREVVHCWKYLKGTANFGLLLRPKPNNLIERINFFTDATWAEDQESRISRSGSLAFWKSCPILWNSKKQKNITMSSTESEMNALSDGEQENQWLSFLIEELWRVKLSPTLFHIDNKGLLEKLKNFGSNSKTKHLDIKIKSLREKFKTNEIDVKLIPSQDMIADSLTKAAPHSSLKKFQSKCLSVLSSTNKEGC
jgi:transposase InsO family protein